MNRIETYQKEEEHRTTDALEDEIRTTRERMDHTLDKLSTKLNPERYIEGAGDWVKGKIDAVDTDSFKETAKRIGRKTSRFIADHPLPVAFGALTVASLFTKRSDYDRKVKDPYIPAHPNTDGPTGKINPTLDAKVKQLPEQSENGTSNGNSDGKIAHATHAVRSGLSTAAHKTGDTFTRGKDEYPAAMCLGAMALGFLAAFALPRTRRENEWCGETSDEIKQDVADRGHKFVDETKETIRHKKDELVGQAKEKTDEAIAKAKGTIDQTVDETASTIDAKIEEEIEPS